MEEEGPTSLPERYVLGRRLGSGGFGQVYAATDRLSGDQVAIKFFAPRGVAMEAVLRAATVEHPNVVPVLASGKHDRVPYVVMPLVRGHTLAHRLEQGAIAPREAIELLTGIAAALDSIHRRGIVHRDVKPSNIMLTDEPPTQVVLFDFGPAPTTDADASGSFVGTPAYAAPEHLRETSVGPAADIYALAAVLTECLTAIRTFGRATHEETMHAHLQRERPLIEVDNPAAAALAPVLEKGLAIDPHQRYDTASELVDAARAALDDVRPEFTKRPLSSARSEMPAPTTVRD
jgi:serine/threonine protein kinase